MLRALPKSQQARWLEIGRAFERVRRPARPGEHVAFTPVAEAGTARTIPTRFPARTARIPSALRPTFADATASPPEASEAPAPPIAAEVSPVVEETPTAPPPAVEPVPATVTSEAVAQAEPEATPTPAESVTAAATEAPTPTADATPAVHAPEPADFFSEGLLRRRQLASAAEWGGWTTYAAMKDIFPGDEAAEGGHIAATPPAASLSHSPTAVAGSPEPPPTPAPECRTEETEPRVSAIEYFRAAPW